PPWTYVRPSPDGIASQPVGGNSHVNCCRPSQRDNFGPASGFAESELGIPIAHLVNLNRRVRTVNFADDFYSRRPTVGVKQINRLCEGIYVVIARRWRLVMDDRLHVQRDGGVEHLCADFDFRENVEEAR